MIFLLKNKTPKAVYSILVTFFLIMTSCQEKTHDIHFYYWRSNMTVNDVEHSYFKQLQCKNLYIRLFDVDIQDSKVLPLAKISTFDKNTLDANYIPVVFITNRSINASKGNEEQLAKQVYSLITEILKTNNIQAPNEIQIDCDWTTTTRNSYFIFLNALKQQSKTSISCTLRMHQVKYQEDTGIPPVDKVYLMCYATANPGDKNIDNSILDIALLKDYTKNINNYPLNMDIALPIYSWAVVTNHLGKIKLINAISIKDLDISQLKKISNNTYKVTEDFIFRGMYLNKGFIIRQEGISPSLIKQAKTYLSEKLKKDYNIVYYHLDSVFLDRFTIDELKN